MSEYEIVYMMSVHTDRLWTIMQFWSSISFGLMIVAHIAAKKLTLPMMTILTFLYVIFSLFILNMLKINGGIGDGYVLDLIGLQNANMHIQQGTKSLIAMNQSSKSLLLIITAFIGTFISALFFLWYSYVTNNKKTPIPSQEQVVTS